MILPHKSVPRHALRFTGIAVPAVKYIKCVLDVIILFSKLICPYHGITRSQGLQIVLVGIRIIADLDIPVESVN